MKKKVINYAKELIKTLKKREMSILPANIASLSDNGKADDIEPPSAIGNTQSMVSNSSSVIDFGIDEILVTI